MRTSKSMENFNKPKEGKVGVKGEKRAGAMSSEEKKQKWIKSLPQQIRHLHHLKCIKDQSISDKTKVEYWKKFNIESKDKEWTMPKNE